MRDRHLINESDELEYDEADRYNFYTFYNGTYDHDDDCGDADDCMFGDETACLHHRRHLTP